MDQTPSFRDEYAFLSNFYPAPVLIQEILYPTAEHAYQAMKTTDLFIRKGIAKLPNPTAAKGAGRIIKKRKDWDFIRLDRMERILWEKFTQNPELGEKLIATGDLVIVERNDWNDKYWGTVDSKGENWMGRLLMKVRGRLIDEVSNIKG